jgi:carbohydrate binding protein with CBM4/9 domain/tetratricopeptide repeat protein
MQLVLDSPAKKLLTLALVIGTTASYFVLTGCNFIASRLGSRSLETRLQLAVRLAPDNAEYHDSLGHLLYRNNQPERALEQYRIATHLNPHDANYWIDLSSLESSPPNDAEQVRAMDRAVQADPKNPLVAMDAADLFLVRGQTEKALREFRVLIEGDPAQAYKALQHCLHIADVDTILRVSLPPEPAAYLAFLDLLTTQNDSAGAAKAWETLVKLGHSIDTSRALLYTDYLLSHREVAHAGQVWNETMALNNLSSYLPGQDNLIVNPSFDFDILNGGFDWRYRRHPNVEVALDASDFHAGHRSLAVTFDGPGISDTGISQFIPLDPGTEYEFSAYFKSDKMDGAGGPLLTVEDAYSGVTYFQSDALKNSDIWKEVSGDFTTPLDAQLVVLRLVRIPAGSPIRGKLWLDNFRLAKKASPTESGGN